MMDKRWKQLGEVLVNYSTAVKPGERVMIAMVEPETYPLVQATYEAAVKAGAYPQVQFLSERLRHSLLKYGNDDQLSWVPEIEAYGMEWADVYIGLRGAHNLYELADVSTEALAKNQVAMGKISTLRWQKTRWVLSRVPNESFAQQAQTDLETIMDMYFDACLLDWPKYAEEWQAMAKRLEGMSDVRIVGKGTDLRFSVEGRKWLTFDGKINMPDGEIFTAPVNRSLNGYIYFENPGVLSGRLMYDIRLEWKDGRLVDATSSTNQDYLRKIVSSDEGASLLGEFAFGTNPYVNRFTNDILIDEKIGGTIHIALGRAYPECGGVNQSAIHWDIVKDLRDEGGVLIDGKTVLENGKLTI
ncbi:MAG TPA: aminopeptidase [Aggregatilineales bacterium]|nr:aminopeptidase [Aggregatilineales bacterium]